MGVTTNRSWDSVHRRQAGSIAGVPPVAKDGGRLGIGAVAGLSILAGLSSAIVALLGQARSATRSIEAAAIEAAMADGTLVPPSVPGGTRAQQRLADHLVHVRLPQGEGIYAPDGSRVDARSRPRSVPEPLRLAMLGDSTSVGYGTTTADELPGVILARGVARNLDRPVQLNSYGLTGARTSDLAGQAEKCLADEPDICVILIGANDLRDMVPPWRSAALLSESVSTLAARGIPVVAGTCPDFGVIIGIPQPLRGVLGTWSTGLAALQHRAVTEAGGATVPLGRLVGPQFAGQPEMFARDHFHPSGAGYGRAMDAMLPVVIAALAPTATTLVEPAHEQHSRTA